MVWNKNSVCLKVIFGTCKAPPLKYNDEQTEWRETEVLWGPTQTNRNRKGRKLQGGRTQRRRMELVSEEIYNTRLDWKRWKFTILEGMLQTPYFSYELL